MDRSPSSPGAARGIYRTNSDGFGETLLTHDSNDNFNPRIALNGAKIAYNTSNADLVYSPSVAVMNVDGTGAKLIILDKPVYPLYAAGMGLPALSPDGSKIAVTTWNEASGISGAIFVMNSDGTNQVMLTNPGGWGSNCSCADMAPSFSPDGTRLSYGHYDSRAGTFDVYVIGVDGSNPTRLTDGRGHNLNPIFVGTKILFFSDRDNAGGGSNGYEIYSMNADGSGLTRLSNDVLYTAFNMAAFQRTSAASGR